MGEPREMNVYEKFDDPYSEAALFDFRPLERPADAPDIEVPGLEDTTVVDAEPEVLDPKESGSPASS